MSSNLESYLSCASSYTQNELFESNPGDLEDPSGDGNATSSHVKWRMDAPPAAPSRPTEWQAEARNPGATGLRVSMVRTDESRFMHAEQYSSPFPAVIKALSAVEALLLPCGCQRGC